MAEAVSSVPDFVTIIQTVGFPIACCIALFIMMIKNNKSHREEVAELKDAIYEMKATFSEASAQQSKELTQAINNNTIALTRLSDRLDKE